MNRCYEQETRCTFTALCVLISHLELLFDACTVLVVPSPCLNPLSLIIRLSETSLEFELCGSPGLTSVSNLISPSTLIFVSLSPGCSMWLESELVLSMNICS